MFVRISTISAEPGRLDDGIAYLREEVLPQVDRMAGSQGLAAWVDRSTNRVAAAALWVDRAALDASAEPVGGLRQDAAKHLGGEATVEVFEAAIVHEVTPLAVGQWSRSTRFDVATADIDRLVQYFETTALPDIKEQGKGLAAAALLIDRENGKTRVVLTFDSREALEASRPTSQQRRDRAVQEIPSLTVTDVIESEVVLAGFREPDDA